MSLQQVDQPGAYGHFTAHVGKDADGTEHEVRVLPQAAARAGSFFCLGRRRALNHRQTEHTDHDRDQEQHRSQGQVRSLHGLDFHGLVDSLIGADGGCRQDENRTDVGADRGARRIERLRQRQAACCRFGPAKHCNIRIGCDLQQGDSRCEHEEREQEQRIRLHRRGRVKPDAADGCDTQSNDDALLVADVFDQVAGGQGRNRVGAEEAELHQRRLEIAQREDRFQVRDQDVVE